MRSALLPAALAAYLSTTAVAIVTVSSSAPVYVVDNHSSDGFVTTVRRLNCDVTSLRYGDGELQYGKLASQIREGLGPTTVSVIKKGDRVAAQCVAENGAYDLIRYMVFRDKEDRIYMATHTNTEPAIGELQYVFGLAGSRPRCRRTLTLALDAAVNGSATLRIATTISFAQRPAPGHQITDQSKQ